MWSYPSHLRCSSPACLPPLPTTAPQLRCDHCARPTWAQWRHTLNIDGEREAHTIVAKRKERKDWRKLLRGGRVDEEVANTWVCVWGSRAHVEVLAQEQKSQKGQKLKLEFQGVPELRSISSQHFTTETWPLWFRDKSQNSNPTRFRQRVRIELFQQKDYFWLLFAILQNSRAHSQLLFWLSQLLEVKTGALHKRNHVFFLHLAPLEKLFHNGNKGEKNGAVHARPQAICGTSLSSNDGKRGHTVLPLSNHLDNHLCVCDSLSMSLLPYTWPPCQPPLPTTAPQLRCNRSARHSWAPYHRGREGGTHHSSKKKRTERLTEVIEKWESRWGSGKHVSVCLG